MRNKEEITYVVSAPNGRQVSLRDSVFHHGDTTTNESLYIAYPHIFQKMNYFEEEIGVSKIDWPFKPKALRVASSEKIQFQA